MSNKIKFTLCFIILTLILTINVKAYEINDKSKIFNEENIKETIEEFESNNNIKIIIHSTTEGTQEHFEGIMTSYENEQSDFILFYFATNINNVGIYVSNNLKSVINDASKALALKTMESFIGLEDYDMAIKAALNNIGEVLKAQRTEIEHEILEIEDKTQQLQISKIGMIFSAIIFILGLIAIIPRKKQKKETNNEFNNN